jgi:membrane dipeptidase
VLLFDAHLDLAMNAVEFNRDLTQSVPDIRKTEHHLRDRPDRGRGTVTLPEMRRAGIGLCVGTQIARVEMNAWSPVTGWRSQAQAWAITQGQLAWYRAMEEQGQMRQIRSRRELEAHLTQWEKEDGAGDTSPQPRVPIGYLLSLEGADSLLTIGHLERSYNDGLRAIGPAHYGPGVYANGTDATGKFPDRGRDLLREIDRLGLILDATHLCDDCFWQAMDWFQGPVWASHHNARTLVPHNRQLSDEMFRTLIARGAVVGIALDAWMIVPGWQRGKTTPQSSGVSLAHLADHIDHYCQLAGNARHVGIGSDLDGGFGIEQTPQDLDTIADLRKLPDILAKRGYKPEDIEGIFSGNFLRFLRQALPE